MHASNPALMFMAKLKRLKGRLKTWNAEIFRNVYVEIQNAVDALDAIQQRIFLKGDSKDLFNGKMNRIANLNSLLARRQALLSQKNRLQWLKDGDRNSTFFHRIYCTRKSHASIKTVQVDNSYYTLESEISQQVVNYYSKLFTKDETLDNNFGALDDFAWNHISDDQNLLLTATKSTEKIQFAAFALDPDSSPGPDDFGDYFYQKCWTIIADDVNNVIIYLFASLLFPSGMNSSFVTLVPKVASSIRISDFRLIVMGNFLYKIFTKIVATRLGSFIGDVLSPSQYGFILGRSIHTCIALRRKLLTTYTWEATSTWQSRLTSLKPLTLYLGIPWSMPLNACTSRQGLLCWFGIYLSL